ncbi:MAG: hypothetical protein ABI837_07865 [Acidobacteriota bacterium]
MKNDGCERYLEDPDGNSPHLEECVECRMLFSALDAPPRYDTITLNALPMAPWEEASHRPWSLIVGGALAIASAILALSAAVGVSPVGWILTAVIFPSPAGVFEAVRKVGVALVHAPGNFQMKLIAAFLVVNVLLIALLRRAPRGVDAPH